jgi:16S rRNA (adenine1518-N6/adenine1519-N6)-dimethyltransferase
MNKSFPFFPKKELGQNFLLNKQILQKIVNFLPIETNTVIIEIGTGYGHLTDCLTDTICYKILSIEKDKNIYNWLKDNKLNKKVSFLNEDALNIDWHKLYEENKNHPLLVVGNLPYYIANSLLIELLNKNKLFKSFCFLVQKEVARR